MLLICPIWMRIQASIRGKNNFNVNFFRPDFTNTEPAANIGPFPQWADKKKIVSMDPLGHLAPWLFKDTMERENSKLLWSGRTRAFID